MIPEKGSPEYDEYVAQLLEEIDDDETDIHLV